MNPFRCCAPTSRRTVWRAKWHDGLVFGRKPGSAFNPGTINNRVGRAWEEAGLERITLHECRHTFASLMNAAGGNAKALSVYMGHASVMVTFDCTAT